MDGAVGRSARRPARARGRGTAERGRVLLLDLEPDAPGAPGAPVTSHAASAPSSVRASPWRRASSRTARQESPSQPCETVPSAVATGSPSSVQDANVLRSRDSLQQVACERVRVDLRLGGATPSQASSHSSDGRSSCMTRSSRSAGAAGRRGSAPGTRARIRAGEQRLERPDGGSVPQLEARGQPRARVPLARTARPRSRAPSPVSPIAQHGVRAAGEAAREAQRSTSPRCSRSRGGQAARTTSSAGSSVTEAA